MHEMNEFDHGRDVIVDAIGPRKKFYVPKRGMFLRNIRIVSLDKNLIVVGILDGAKVLSVFFDRSD